MFVLLLICRDRWSTWDKFSVKNHFVELHLGGTQSTSFCLFLMYVPSNYLICNVRHVWTNCWQHKGSHEHVGMTCDTAKCWFHSLNVVVVHVCKWVYLLVAFSVSVRATSAFQSWATDRWDSIIYINVWIKVRQHWRVPGKLHSAK